MEKERGSKMTEKLEKVKKEDRRQYPKLYRMDNQSTHEERFPMDKPIVIQEKLDGSNVTIKFVKGEMELHSRTMKLDKENKEAIKNWGPLFKWAEENKPKLLELANAIFEDMSAEISLHGEWLMMAKLPYNKTHKNTYHIFDIRVNKVFLGYKRAKNLVERFGFNFVPIVDEAHSLTSIMEGIETYVEGQKTLLEHSDSKREGVVVKTLNGQHRLKFVSKEFKESMGQRGNKSVPLFMITRDLIDPQRIQKYLYRLKETGVVDGYIDFSDGKTIGTLFKNTKILIDDFMDEEGEKFMKLVKKTVNKQIGKSLREYIEAQQKLITTTDDGE